MTAALLLAVALVAAIVLAEVARRALRSDSFRRGFSDGIKRNEEDR